MQKFIFRQIANLFQGYEPKLKILIYHRVMPVPDPLRSWEVDAQQFKKHMEWISGIFNVIPLPEAINQLRAGQLKRRSLAITFDDGYLDNWTEAYPILNQFGFHATFFCTSAWLEGGLMWNDQVIEAVRKWPENHMSIDELELRSLPVQTLSEKKETISKIIFRLKYQEHNKRQEIADGLTSSTRELPNLMMQAKHIKLLKERGMEIGGHTHSHPILAKLTSTEVINELDTNKILLEKLTQEKLRIFAYPNGKLGQDYTSEHEALLSQSGYEAAVSTDLGCSNQSTNLYQLRRSTPWDTTERKFIGRLISQ